jgi:hypothetical protein
VFLLWPGPARVHKRRLRWKAAVHPHPEATVRGARSRRVSLLPVVPPIRRGLGAAPVAKAVARLDLPAGAMVASTPLVAVRSAPASAVGLRAPHALRRVFARPLGPPFLSDRSPERDLLFVLSSATMEAAARAERDLQSRALQGEAARLVSEVSDLAFGPAPLEGFWGDQPCVDSLRLRVARSSPKDDVAASLGWEGFYAWAGSRIGPDELSRLPAELLPDAAAAVAAVHGYRRAFELLAARASSPDASGEALRVTRLLALRCALSGLFFPALVRFLLPTASARIEESASASAWEPAMLALHAYRLSGDVAGATHVAAAIVSTMAREQFGRIARRSLPAYRPRAWGAPPPTREMEAEHRQVVAVVGVLVNQLFWTYECPWPEGWCGPDVIATSRRVSEALGGMGPAHDVFMDDSLALAAGHALQGHTPSARATLASTRIAEVFGPARDRLARSLDSGTFDARAAPIVGTALSRDFQGLLERLRHTPDPAEFGAPDWRRDALRGRLLSRLQQKGPRGLALALRTVLGPAFGDLDRFWLAPSVPRSAALAALAVWLDRQAPLIPSDRDFILFLDEKCRQMTE